ncbi:3-deoxy-D-manno-octulosonic acid transferase [Leeuwenhoekiella sp. MAR_2009_132]|uniref:3-deoxy-D-manno-octulosonic acid transferase n=1 Tax=Leeuwenhoekiella sp. MAR_2009_132 TaxID=1392489 RepID=UPI00048D8016|nr:glycosyltransferase N-terminal domain-containing protein [Leeuwenhoekiella sp. MAR_2009_132]
MQHLYSFIISLFNGILPVFGLFVPKLKEFRHVRENVFSTLEAAISKEDNYIWVHAASLGEYEQAVPVLEEIKTKYTNFKILLTFFSPSGYDVKYNTPLAEVVTYLPLDTKVNARRFLKIVKPKLAIFVKYEFWPNFLNELRITDTHTILISGIFRSKQPFFKFYGKWMVNSLNAFNYFFLQNTASLELLKQLGFKNAIVSGDTRFDRVSRQLSYDNLLSFIEEFKQNELLLVCGSTWQEDEALLLNFVNSNPDLKILIAPHKINSEKIDKLIAAIEIPVVRYSQKDTQSLKDARVLILDTIGLLSKAYAYASIAYVGGAAGQTGMHNILEPATFGIPILTGTRIDKFPEALELRRLAGLYTVNNESETASLLNRFLNDDQFRLHTGMINGHYVSSNTGATTAIMAYLNQTLTASFK